MEETGRKRITLVNFYLQRLSTYVLFVCAAFTVLALLYPSHCHLQIVFAQSYSKNIDI